MKVNALASLSILSLVSGGVAWPRVRDDEGPENTRSKVTAFVRGEDGALKVECWEISDLLPDSQTLHSGGTIHRQNLANKLEGVTMLTFSSGSTIFSSSAAGVHTDAIDFSNQPNLITLKDGLIVIETSGTSGDRIGTRADNDNYVYSLENGDDWFYFEDHCCSSDISHSSKAACAKVASEDTVNIRSVSSSDTTLVNFQYAGTPKHKVLHEGRCSFGGLTPASTSRRFHVQSEF